MTKLYNKSELWFSIIWIIIYVIGASLMDELSIHIGISKSFTSLFLLLISLLFVIWIFKNKLNKKYGLCKPECRSKYFLYYTPLLVLISLNLWFGIVNELNLLESIFYIISMLCVGFVEEIIFRGFLFKAMEKDNLKAAIIVSSLTFGAGHIINMFTSGFSDITANLCQVCYATAVGFLFVILFLKSKSLWPCIITHSLVNALSLFLNEAIYSGTLEIIGSIITIVVSVAYSILILKIVPKEDIITNE